MFDFFKKPYSRPRSRPLFRKPTKDSKEESIFGRRRHISRESLRRRIKESVSDIPGGRKWFHQKGKERGVASELFGEKEYGGFISRKDFEKRLRGLHEERQRAKTFTEKKDAIKKIALLKKLRGI